MKEAINQRELSALWEWIDSDDRSASTVKGEAEQGAGTGPRLLPPRHLIEAPLVRVLSVARNRFGCPIDRVSYNLHRYVAGGWLGWHIDRRSTQPASLPHTASCSILVSEPGVDFDGGILETAFGDVDFALGDAAVFTPTTRHRVREVTAGVRYVLAGFGCWDDEDYVAFSDE